MKDHFEDFFSFFNLDSNIFASIYENTKQTEGIITNTIDWLDSLFDCWCFTSHPRIFNSFGGQHYL